MANEFGNVGAVSSISKVRTSNKKMEVSTSTGAEYEAFYGGYWRDISSDYSYDVSKAGNSFARCIRWDDGFRSYREDRGLIIRKKEDTAIAGAAAGLAIEEDTAFGNIGAISSTFGKAAVQGFGVSLAVKAFKTYLEPALANTALGKAFSKKPLTQVGKFLSANKVGLAFTAFNLFQNNGLSTGEKLGSAAVSIGVGAVLNRFGPAKYLIGPAIGIVESVFHGESFEIAASRAAGHVFGGQFGKLVTGGSLFGSTGYKATNPNAINQVPPGYNNINQVNQGQVATVMQQTYNQTFSTPQKHPNQILFGGLTAISKETTREIKSLQQNKAAAASASNTNGLKRLSNAFKSNYKPKGKVF